MAIIPPRVLTSDLALTVTHTLTVQSTMKVLVILALVTFATAFDFPEEWEAWKKVRIYPYKVVYPTLHTHCYHPAWIKSQLMCAG